MIGSCEPSSSNVCPETRLSDMNPAVSRALLITLGAGVVSWVLFMVGLFTDLYVVDVFEDGQRAGQNPAVPISTYIFFAAVAVFSLAALWGQRIAIAQRVAHGPHSRLERATHRFATLSLIIGMGIAAVLAISAFLEGFGRAEEQRDLVVRLGNVYGPILLYTALVVTTLLLGFVFRRDTLPKTTDAVDDHTEDAGAGLEGRRDLGASYAIPIVATAAALIAGLVVYDATGNSLEVWVWVAIQLVIGAGIVAGTIFGERAIAQGPTSLSSRSRITRGSRGLSFVLSIVYAATVGMMGFGYGGSAIDSLRIAPYFYLDILAGPSTPVENVDVGLNAWDMKDGSSVSITIEPVGEVILADTIDDPDYFYETRPLPGNLEPGDYTLVAEGTSADGRPLAREIEMSVGDSGQVVWDTNQPFDEQWEQDNEVIVTADGRWLLEDFLPALVLIVLSLGSVYLTITERNRPARGLQSISA